MPGDQPGRRLLVQRAGERVLGGHLDLPRRREHDHRRAVAQAERLEPVRQVGAAQLAGDEAREHVAGQPALGVVGHAPPQQLERHDRDRLVEREPVELGQRAAVLGRHQPRLRGRPVAGHKPRPAGPAACAARAARAPGPPARRRGRSRAGRRRGRARPAPRPAPATTASGSGSPAARRASTSPRASNTIAAPPTSEASAPATPSRPRSESTIRSSRSWAESARWSTA